MNSLTLRAAVLQDCEFAYDVRCAAFRSYVEEVEGWDDDKQRELHTHRFATQDFRVIQLAGAAVGIMAITVATDCLKVNQLFLLPQHQGKGIGRWCMTRFMEEARERGLPLRLRVMKVNPRARVFYERLGFRCIGETDTHDLMQWPVMVTAMPHKP